MKFMQEHGVPQGRAEVVWDAIALHTNAVIAERKAREIAMVSLGAAMAVLRVVGSFEHEGGKAGRKPQ